MDFGTSNVGGGQTDISELEGALSNQYDGRGASRHKVNEFEDFTGSGH